MDLIFIAIYLFFNVLCSDSVNLPVNIEILKSEAALSQSTNINVETIYPLNITNVPSNWSHEIIDCDYNKIYGKNYPYNFTAHAVKNKGLISKIIFEASKDSVITCFIVKNNNQWRNEHIRVFSGGRNKDHVSFEARSEVSFGFRFELIIYEAKDNKTTTLNNATNQITNNETKPYGKHPDNFNCPKGKSSTVQIEKFLDNFTAAKWAYSLEDCDYNNINGPKFQGTFFQPRKNSGYVSELIGYELSDEFSISCYNVTSNTKNGKIGVILGGRNKSSVYFEAKSKSDEGFSFEVTIYSTPKISGAAATNNVTKAAEETSDLSQPQTEATKTNLDGEALLDEIVKTRINQNEYNLTSQSSGMTNTEKSVVVSTPESKTEEVTNKTENFCLLNITQVPSDWMDEIYDCENRNRKQGNGLTYNLYNVGANENCRDYTVGFEASYEGEIICYIVKSKNPNGKIRVVFGGRNQAIVLFEAKHLPGKHYDFEITVFDSPKKDGKNTCSLRNNVESLQTKNIKASTTEANQLSVDNEFDMINYARQVEKMYTASKTLTVCFPALFGIKIPLKITEVPSEWSNELEDCDYTRIHHKKFEAKFFELAKPSQSVFGWTSYEAEKGHEISCFIVKSNNGDGMNGTVRVISGGRNKRNVEFQALSQFEKGFSFNVKIFSAPKVC